MKAHTTLTVDEEASTSINNNKIKASKKFGFLLSQKILLFCFYLVFCLVYIFFLYQSSDPINVLGHLFVFFCIYTTFLLIIAQISYSYNFKWNKASAPVQIKYFESQILGKGSGRTIIYKGTFGKLPVAVKIIPRLEFHKEAENEIKFLIECNGHPNIVMYHASEKRPEAYYLALELCEGKTLKDWVVNKNCIPMNIDNLNILNQVTEGIGFLHENGIIHRDLKPSNILFSIVGTRVFVKVSDFGISKLLESGINSRTMTSFGGTRGWIAAEMLLAEKLYRETGTWKTTKMPKLTKKLDIFSLGCIFYFVLTNGQHPFGDDEDIYNYNIKKNLAQINSSQHCLRLRCNLSLIQNMISSYPNNRPDIQYIQAHPLFWSNQKTLNFLVDLSNYVSDTFQSSQVQSCAINLETKYFLIISKGQNAGWFISFEGRIRNIFEERYKNHKTSVKQLIRLIRNLNNHYDEPRNQEIRQLIGEKPDAFMDFWLDKFPLLINETREAFQDLQGESNLKQFYK